MYRPKLHLTPDKGWMNDPNGAVFFNGKYHLFYQHDPNSLVWDRMHWGHAVSDDLVHWETLPVALEPDEMGDIYSGSSFVDEENRSGLGCPGKPVLLLFYTSHNMETKREQQCAAYSLDGRTFRKYEGNPIIPGSDHTPARDPHVFRNQVLGGFSLCLTVETAVEFYHSEDLLHWEKTGEFTLPEAAFHGMIECPCLVCARLENHDPEVYRHVLLLSMDVPEEELTKFPEGAVPHRRLMQYFVGDFDGRTFVCDASSSGPALLDMGPDLYAGTIFSHVPEPVFIAWLGDFSEGARKIPMEKEGFRGVLSYPRKLSLKLSEGKYHLIQRFYPDPEKVCGKYGDDPLVSYEKSSDRAILRDHIVEEQIGSDGSSYTSFLDPGCGQEGNEV